MTSRENILSRIREALRVPTPLPDHAHASPGATESTDAAALRQWLPPVGDSFASQCELFARNAAALKAEFKEVADRAAAIAEVKRLAEEGGWKKVALHRGPETEAIGAALGRELLYTDQTYRTADLESCDAGITACDALVAQTGTVLVSSRSCGGRALSVLPPHHVVVATREQLLPDLPAAFAWVRQRYDGQYPSCLSFITGPSRTGDIERILVLGAHGPKRLTIVLIR